MYNDVFLIGPPTFLHKRFRERSDRNCSGNHLELGQKLKYFCCDPLPLDQNVLIFNFERIRVFKMTMSLYILFFMDGFSKLIFNQHWPGPKLFQRNVKKTCRNQIMSAFVFGAFRIIQGVSEKVFLFEKLAHLETENFFWDTMYLSYFHQNMEGLYQLIT